MKEVIVEIYTVLGQVFYMALLKSQENQALL